MKKKIAITLATFILMILPFIVGNSIGVFTPYVDTNSFSTYVLIWSAISIAFVVLIVVFLKYAYGSLEKTIVAGGLLFLLISPIIGIIGLVSPPDLSLTMLEHPEREHVRYLFLFLAAFLFGFFFLALMGSYSKQMKNQTKWIMVLFFILAFTEFLWEFSHHYLYPDAMKEWMDQGGKAEEFGKSYDNITIINIGVLGRLFQFSLISWISIYLYHMRQTRIWSPIVITFLSLVGIASAITIFLTEMNLPKGFEILFLFFIPGIPFLLLYWLGVAMIMRFKSETTA